MTMDRAIVNAGEREFACGITYTAVSRVRNLQSLAFDPMSNFVRITNIFNSSSFKNMRTEITKRMKKETTRQVGNINC